MAKKKAPAFQFYVRDWLSEPEVRRLCPASRGIWIDVLAYMWLEEEQGKLQVEIPELARMCGASESEINRFIQEAQRVNLCDVSLFCPPDVPDCPQNVLLVSRRMYGEWKVKYNEKLKKRKQRSRQGVLSDVPEKSPPSSSSASASAYNTLKKSNKYPNTICSENPHLEESFCDADFYQSENPDPNAQDSASRPNGPKRTDGPSKSRPSYQGFKSCFQIYPLRQGEEEAWREWCRLEDNGTLADVFVVRDAITLLKQEDDRWKKNFAPSFYKFLNGKRWNDEPYKEAENSGYGNETLSKADFLSQVTDLRGKNSDGDRP